MNISNYKPGDASNELVIQAMRDYQRQRQMTLGDLLLENRVIFLQGEIYDGNANELVMKLLYLDALLVSCSSLITGSAELGPRVRMPSMVASAWKAAVTVGGEQNLTRFNPLPAKVADKAIPLLVTVPNAAVSLQDRRVVVDRWLWLPD